MSLLQRDLQKGERKFHEAPGKDLCPKKKGPAEQDCEVYKREEDYGLDHDGGKGCERERRNGGKTRIVPGRERKRLSTAVSGERWT